MRWKVGEVTITKIVDLEVVGGSRFILPDALYDEVRPIEWLIPHFANSEGKLRMSIHSFLIQTPKLRIIVDTGLGNDKQNRRVPGWNNRQASFLQDIAAAGFPRESVDLVVCTHLHVDHVGWNTMLVDGRWQPTFPNARYVFARVEYEHGMNQKAGSLNIPVFEDSVKPIHEAGKADLVETDHRICDELRFVPAPGHSPGHACIAIQSAGKGGLIIGDIAHHPCQLARPHWRALADEDPAKAEATRRKILAELCGTDVLAIGTHFTGPTAGWVEADGDAWKLRVASSAN